MNLKLARQYYDSPEYMGKLQARASYLSMMENSPAMRLKYTMEDFAVNPISFIETFAWVKIPQVEGQIKPFFLWDYQRDIIFKLQECENDELEHEILIDKPREMGVTWTLAWYMIWRWLFSPNWSALILSRTEAEVDQGDADPDSSLFGKFRWGLDKLPAYMLPTGYTPRGKKGTSTDMKLRIMNPYMKTSLIGSTSNSEAGRSRRYSFIFIDECFAIEGFTNIYRSLQTVAKTKVFASTVRVGTVFKKFRDLCKEKGDYISLSWKQHPWKDQTWYEDQLRKAEVDPEVMKEIEVDYNINIKSQYYPEITKATLREFEYNPNLPLYVALDFGSQDKTVIIYVQFDGKVIYIPECFASQRRALDWYVPFLNSELIGQAYELNTEQYNDYQLKFIEKLKKFKKPLAYFGEAAHFQKNMPSNKSIADELVKYAIRLRYNQYGIKHEVRRHATASLLPRMEFNEGSAYVVELYDALGASRYNNALRSITNKDTVLKPVHDPEISDYRSALENFCVNFPRIARVQREDIKTHGGVDPLMRALTAYLRT